jgi:hypothetical protein
MQEQSSQPAMVPYERFAEVNRQLKELRAELTAMKESSSDKAGAMPNMQIPSKEEIFQRLVEDPDGYFRELISNVAMQEMQLLREEMELKNAMQVAKQKYPEFQDFQEHILQEVMGFINADEDVSKLSWNDLLDKGFSQFQSKFKSAAEKGPGTLAKVATAGDVKGAYMEGQVARKPQPLAPSFTREEIGRMSLEEFLQNETAINKAMQNNRVR